MSNKKSAKSRRSRKRKTPNKFHQNVKLLVAVLFVTGFVIGTLVALSHLKRAHYTPPKPPVAKIPERTADRASLVSDIQLELDSALWRAGIPFDRLRVVTREETVNYEVRAKMPAGKIVDDLAKRLVVLSPALELQVSRDDKAMTIHHGRDTLFQIRFLEDEKHALPAMPKPRLAIIVDDLGGSLSTARALLDIDLPLTFSIMPNVEKSRQVAELAHSRNREIMLHIPMEPRSYPDADPGQNALFARMGAREVKQLMNAYLEQVPHVVGGNNHMGSRFTENGAGMAAVLEFMVEKRLFFIDSRTTNQSVAAKEAQRVGIPFAARDVFLDNVREVDAIGREIRKVAGLARRNGEAIGICHPYPETIKALAREAATLRSQGVEVVPASRLVK